MVVRKHVSEPARRTPVVAEADVVVVGGGTAGVVGALAAAREGAKTILVEQLEHLGGTIHGGGMAWLSFFNPYKMFPRAKKEQVVFGLPWTLLTRIKDAGGSFGPVENEFGGEKFPDFTVVDPEIYKKVTFEMMRENHVHLMMRTWFSEALVENGKLKGIIVENKDGRSAILAKQFLDCTGDGDLAARAGCDFIREADQDKLYATTQVFGMGNVDLKRTFEWAKAQGICSRVARVNVGTPDETVVGMFIEFRDYPPTAKIWQANGWWGPVFCTTRKNEVYFLNGTMAYPGDALKQDWVHEAEMKLRTATIWVFADMLKKYAPGFESAYINRTAPLLGVRRTRVIKCEYDITSEDVVNERGFADEIGRFGWVDIEDKSYSPKGGGSYGIPYRALLPLKVDNLLVSGRMITAEWEAHMSTRNTVASMVQAEAAGTALAMAAAGGVTARRVDVGKLQARLLERGVYLKCDGKKSPPSAQRGHKRGAAATRSRRVARTR
jgi:hypothetical protein